jgi:hypothetical protein
MTPASSSLMTPSQLQVAPIQKHVEIEIESLLAAFPNPARLSAEERRGIIARYSGVLEGNFIYWMTGAYIAVKSAEARAKIMENLHEEVRDSHPLMMRKFAKAAHSFPDAADSLAVDRNLTNMRLFIGRLSPIPILITMAFFEGWIQRFMPYLADLAERQGSKEMEYTDVHGVCDIAHTEGLYRALDAEIALSSDTVTPDTDLFEGVQVLSALIRNMAAA